MKWVTDSQTSSAQVGGLTIVLGGPGTGGLAGTGQHWGSERGGLLTRGSQRSHGGVIVLAEDKFSAREMELEHKCTGQEKMKMGERAAKLPTKKAQTSRVRRGEQMLRE